MIVVPLVVLKMQEEDVGLENVSVTLDSKVQIVQKY
jgi:hypothetical protein